MGVVRRAGRQAGQAGRAATASMAKTRSVDGYDIFMSDSLKTPHEMARDRLPREAVQSFYLFVLMKLEY